MSTASELRERANRCFDSVQTRADPQLQDEARTRGYRYLREADALERKEAAGMLPLLPPALSGRMTPLQTVAFFQLARVEAHISALVADDPPAHSARANILSALRKKKAELEQVCGLRAAEELGR
jgi:hypothetical protein